MPIANNCKTNQRVYGLSEVSDIPLKEKAKQNKTSTVNATTTVNKTAASNSTTVATATTVPTATTATTATNVLDDFKTATVKANFFM